MAHSLTNIPTFLMQVKCEKKGIEVVTLLLSEILGPDPDPKHWFLYINLKFHCADEVREEGN